MGLLFVDFETGGLLQITGRAQVDWAPKDVNDPGARRMIDVTVEAVVDRAGALSLRWETDATRVRRLAVTRKVAESTDITSFYLSPIDGRPLVPFKAGQHLPVELEIPRQPGKVRRAYSLSGAPADDGYRLSIKREAKGVASRFMHDAVAVGDIIEARRPTGDFVIPCSQCPLVLASAGVGLTPMVSMLHAAAGTTGARPVWFVHGARNGANHALRDEVDRLAKAHPTLSTLVLYSKPGMGDLVGRDYDAVGRVTAESLLNLNAGPEAHYLLCGPAQFLADIRSGLEAAGVRPDQIHFETFGPTG